MIDLSKVHEISMLELPVLERLREIGREDDTAILEIGSYIGGSTLALASGHLGTRLHAVVDCGGSYVEHPTLPSADILADWRSNMARFGMSEVAQMIEGWSTDTRVRDKVIHRIGQIGLFFFDGDGRCAEQFALYAPYMRPGCRIVLDDYVTHDGNKSDIVKPWVDEMVGRRALIDGELIDGTWFGSVKCLPDTGTTIVKSSATPG